MKHIYVLLFLITPSLCMAQELYHISFEQNQTTLHTSQTNESEISLPAKGSTIIMGGLNNLDGMGNYLNVFGSKLIVDSLDIAMDGTQNVVLRREDGNNFFNLYPTMKAKLTPVRHPEKNTIESNSLLKTL